MRTHARTRVPSPPHAQVSAFARLDIDPDSIMWRRVMDINDRCAAALAHQLALHGHTPLPGQAACLRPAVHATPPLPAAWSLL